MMNDHFTGNKGYRGEEMESARRAYSRLGSWADRLKAMMRATDGDDLADLMFEARVAAVLQDHGHAPVYEYKTGVGSSSVDFMVPGNPPWLIETVRIRTRDAMQKAERVMECEHGMTLVSNSMGTDVGDKGRDFACEMTTTQRKIIEKVFKNEKKTKFPEPAGFLHAIFIDVTRFNLGVSDGFDYAQLAFGHAGLKHLSPQERSINAVCLDEGAPFLGLFDPRLQVEGSGVVRSRIHVLGFVNHESYNDREIESAILVANGGLLKADDWHETWPLKSRRAL